MRAGEGGKEKRGKSRRKKGATSAEGELPLRTLGICLPERRMSQLLFCFCRN